MFRPTVTALALSLVFGASASAQPYQRGYDYDDHHHHHSDDHGGYDHDYDDHYHGHRYYYWDHYDHEHHDHHSQPARRPGYVPYQQGMNRHDDGGFPAYEEEYPTRPQGPGPYSDTTPYPQGRKNSEYGPRGNYEQPGYQPELTDPRLGPEMPQNGYQGPRRNVQPQRPQYQSPQYGERQPDYGDQPQPFDRDQNTPGPYPYEPGTRPSGPSQQMPKYSSPYGPAPAPQYSQPQQGVPQDSQPQQGVPYQSRGKQQYLPLPPGDRQTPAPAPNGGLPAPPDTLPEILP